MKLRSSKVVGSLAASTKRTLSLKREENVKRLISREGLHLENNSINSQEQDVVSEAGSPLTSFPSSPVQRSPNPTGESRVEIKKEFIKVEKIEPSIIKDTSILPRHKLK
ncbi:hypothetical protein DSO57_1036474 [Entomophthora muscae]|uniref:Uncharacterized protein n=1 Tax=Entomophthora muscae TaxID=34485 RepID=A0ACC2RED9_9FUNG|nr:hypothetical protein DSO57_1036474 [Entomophthora muscae]